MRQKKFGRPDCFEDSVQHEAPPQSRLLRGSETFAFFVFMVLLHSALSSAAQTPTSTQVQQATKSQEIRSNTSGTQINPSQGLHLDVELTLVNVSVVDPYNRLVPGLDSENFRVFEDKVEQEITSFSSEDVPISIGLIFDCSGSMGNKLAEARAAAVEFLRTANPEDEFFLVSFNDRAELTESFTNSVEDLQSRLTFISSKGRTALLDAIYLGLSEMRKARNAKRALLILSDGGDNHSRYHERDIKRLLKEADTQLYAIGLFEELGHRGRTLEEINGPSLLSEITEMTGGRLFALEDINELPNVAARIALELRNQYVLGYRPNNSTHDGRWRKIKVTLQAPRGLPPLTVYSKKGYYAQVH